MYLGHLESKECLAVVYIAIVVGHCCYATKPLLQAQSETIYDTCLSCPFKICNKIENPAKCDAVIHFLNAIKYKSIET